MESLVDIVTLIFQANFTVVVVFTAGYIFAGRYGKTSPILSRLGNSVLLPCLLFTYFAGSTSLNWKLLLQALWPILVIALSTHVLSIAYSLFAKRFFAAPPWIAQSLVYNNAGSFPLLLLAGLSFLSTEEQGLAHLKWRSMDGVKVVTERIGLYILLNLLVTTVARSIIDPLVTRISPRAQNIASEDDDTDGRVDQGGIALPADEDDLTERTPLIAPASSAFRSRLAIKSTYTSLVVIAPIAGLVIALIKPLQRVITGLTVESSEGNWFWHSIGAGLIAIGGVYAVVDILKTGAEVKETEDNTDKEEPVPPTLGAILTIVLWRFALIPLIVLYIVYGFRKIPSTKAYLQDPAFTFALAITTFSPPTAVPNATPYQSYVIFSTFLVSLLTCLPIAIALAIPGRGVSYAVDFDLVKALKSAGGGGLAGAAAMVVQVLTLMPMRTIMNYQYRYGGSMKSSAKKLYEDGGFKRYYAGLPAALFQGPFSRFGDTAANAGIIALLESFTWPVLVKTVAASVASACFRMILTPVDTLKTTQQTKGGKAGLKLLKDRIKEKGIGCLWYGALATAAATFVGHYPWFGTYNYLQAALPPPHNLAQRLLRQAFIGFAASVVSDTISNSLRVVKTYRQVHETDVGYLTAAKEIVSTEGFAGLFGRGLPTRLLTNGLQGLFFSILWKFFADLIAGDKGSGTGK